MPIEERRIAGPFLVSSLLLALVAALPLKGLTAAFGGVPLWFFPAFGFVYVALSIPVIRAARRRTAAVACALFLGCLGAMAVPWTGTERFSARVARVRVGMSRAEVESLMVGALHGTGWREPGISRGEVEVPGCDAYRWTDQPPNESDWGVVCFERGRVSRVEFWPD